MARGGTRPGAGRPVNSSTLALQAMRKRFMERFEKIADRAFDAVEDLALGIVVVEGVDDEGKPRIYRRAPEKDILKELVQQGIGKPSQAVEVEGDMGVIYKIIKG